MVGVVIVECGPALHAGLPPGSCVQQQAVAMAIGHRRVKRLDHRVGPAVVNGAALEVQKERPQVGRGVAGLGLGTGQEETEDLQVGQDEQQEPHGQRDVHQVQPAAAATSAGNHVGGRVVGGHCAHHAAHHHASCREQGAAPASHTPHVTDGPASQRVVRLHVLQGVLTEAVADLKDVVGHAAGGGQEDGHQHPGDALPEVHGRRRGRRRGGRLVVLG